MRPLSLLLLLAAACDTTSGEPDFGFGYAVASASLDGDTLRATVSYSGGCQDHTFRAESRRSGDGAEVWLVHGGTPDPCDAYLTENVAVLVSVATDAAFVRMLTPSDGRIVLR